MNAAHVLELARTLGITLIAAGAKLRCEAPTGRLTPEIRTALTAHKAAILALLEAERMAERRTVRCRDCRHFIAFPPIQRASGTAWEMPGGCVQGRTSPGSTPAVYPFTGWYCDCWASRTLQ